MLSYPASTSTFPTTTNSSDFPEWRIALASKILENGSFPDGQVTSDIRAFADEYDVSFATARTAYYNYTKKVPQDLLDEITARNYQHEKVHKSNSSTEQDQDTTEVPKEQLTQKQDTESKHIKEKPSSVLDLYPVGSIVEVEVTLVLQHGAVVVTKDENRQEGFIYVGNVTNKFINDINKYFRFGDTVRAKVLKYDEIKGQLTLSTKNLPLKEHGVAGLGENWKPDPINPLSKDQARLEALKATLEANSEVKTDAAPEEAEAPEVTEKAPMLLDSVNQSELNDIRGFVKGIIGYDPSSEALETFLSLFTNHGVFNTSVAMAKAAETFEVDLGLLLAQKVEAVLKSNSPS